MKKLFLFSLLICIISPTLSAQNKKKIKEKGIIEKISYDYDLKGNKEVKIIRLKEIFDIRGNLTEEIKYNKDGKQEKHFHYKYDKHDKLITKISYDTNGKIKKTTIYIYKNGLKVSKIVKDQKNNIIDKETYEYKLSK